MTFKNFIVFLLLLTIFSCADNESKVDGKTPKDLEVVDLGIIKTAGDLSYDEIYRASINFASTRKGQEYIVQATKVQNQRWREIINYCYGNLKEKGETKKILLVIDSAGKVRRATTDDTTDFTSCLIPSLFSIKYPEPPFEAFVLAFDFHY